jgi:hypothetical protein
MDEAPELNLPDTSSISNRADFAAFVSLLLADYQQNSAAWENRNLPDFLEAMAAYATDIDGYYRNMSLPLDADSPSWRVFADMLRGATIYE